MFYSEVLALSFSGSYDSTGRYLVDKWGTNVFFNWKLVHHMVLVKLPDNILPPTSGVKRVYDSKDAQLIEIKLRRYKIEVSGPLLIGQFDYFVGPYS